MPKYISLMSDFGFKKVFANPDHPHILIGFIESIVPELSIVSIEHIDTTQMSNHKDDRVSIFDVFCRLNDDSLVVVEMQQVRQEYYVDRTILYASHIIQRQSRKGQWQYELPKIYVISLMNFRLSPTDRNLIHTVKLQSDQHPDQPFYDKLNLIYIQLPNLSDKLSDNPYLEYWLTMIRHLHTREEPMTIDPDTKFTKAMIDAMTLAEFEQLSPDEKVLVDIAQYAETEEYSKMWTAHHDGLVQGLEQGEHQAKLETARNFLRLGLSIEQVSIGTGLSIERVTNLKANLDSDSK